MSPENSWVIVPNLSGKWYTTDAIRLLFLGLSYFYEPMGLTFHQASPKSSIISFQNELLVFIYRPIPIQVYILVQYPTHWLFVQETHPFPLLP